MSTLLGEIVETYKGEHGAKRAYVFDDAIVLTPRLPGELFGMAGMGVLGGVGGGAVLGLALAPLMKKTAKAAEQRKSMTAAELAAQDERHVLLPLAHITRARLGTAKAGTAGQIELDFDDRPAVTVQWRRGNATNRKSGVPALKQALRSKLE